MRPRLVRVDDGWIDESTGERVADEDSVALEALLLGLAEALRARRGGPPPSTVREIRRPKPTPGGGSASLALPDDDIASAG